MLGPMMGPLRGSRTIDSTPLFPLPPQPPPPHLLVQARSFPPNESHEVYGEAVQGAPAANHASDNSEVPAVTEGAEEGDD